MYAFTTATATLGLLLATTAADDGSASNAPWKQELGAPAKWVRPDAAIPAAPGPAGCLLYKVGAESTPSSECLECHDGSVAKAHLRSTHPVDMDYAMAQHRNRSGLRPEAEVVRRGGFLPDGKVRCTSCHDAGSPWAYKISLPAGAVARPAVDPFRRATYGTTASTARAELPPGSKVSPKPLCLLCHAMD